MAEPCPTRGEPERIGAARSPEGGACATTPALQVVREFVQVGGSLGWRAQAGDPVPGVDGQAAGGAGWRSNQDEQARGHRDDEGCLKAERPSHFGLRGERFEVGARHRLRGDGPGDGLGLGAFDPCRFKGAGGAECVEGVGGHGGASGGGGSGRAVQTFPFA